MKRRILAMVCAVAMTFTSIGVMAPMEDVHAEQVTDENGFVLDGTTLVGYEGKATEIEIPNGVTSIGEYAFYCCSDLTSVDIPDSVTII